VGLSFCRWILCRFYVVVYRVFVSIRVACFFSVHYRHSGHIRLIGCTEIFLVHIVLVAGVQLLRQAFNRPT